MFDDGEMRIFAWALQTLILATGIYLFLRFVRVTRGSRLVRGLVISLLVGVLGLWGISKALELEELTHIIRGVTGFVVVIFAIIFQPELRRGIAQLGEHSMVQRLMKRLGPDTVSEVVQAVSVMAERRNGALIAFEREASLDSYVEGAVRIDSRVSQPLLESLFHPGGALHDGAVVIKNERIAAAGCLFPLTENQELARSTGTRHRAALGLTDETDAVCIIVSEETGAISLCSRGQMRYDLPRQDLERELRERLGPERGEKAAASSGPLAALGLLRRDAPWMAGSLALAGGILYLAHQDISISDEYSVKLVGRPAHSAAKPAPGELWILLSDESIRLLPHAGSEPLKVAVTGSRAQLDEIGGALSGVLELPVQEEGPVPLDLDLVRWHHPGIGLRYEWTGGEAPRIEAARFVSRRHPLSPENAVVDASELDPRYEVWTEMIQFEPSYVEIEGPAQLLPEIGTELPLRLETIRLTPEDRSDHRERVGLAPELAAMGFSIKGEGSVRVVVPIAPAAREAGVVTREIALVCLDPARTEELAGWRLPSHAQTARFTIMASGLIPATADPGSPALRERTTLIKRFVEESLVVFVDIADLPPRGEGRAVPVRWTWRKDWRRSLESLRLDMGSLGEREELDVKLDSQAEILLEKVTNGTGAEGGAEQLDGFGGKK